MPKYIKEILTILGFTTSLAYEGLNASNMEQLMEKIETKVKSSKNLLDSDRLKGLIQEELDIQCTSFDNFSLPFGHRLALESFANKVKSSMVIICADRNISNMYNISVFKLLML